MYTPEQNLRLDQALKTRLMADVLAVGIGEMLRQDIPTPKEMDHLAEILSQAAAMARDATATLVEFQRIAESAAQDAPKTTQ